MAAAGLSAMDQSRIFLQAGKFAIDWDIGFQAAWPPYPVDGGQGFRYSITDNMTVGLKVLVPPFFYGSVQVNLFYSWRFLKPPSGFPELCADISCDIVRSNSGEWHVEPVCGLSLGYTTDSMRYYLSAEARIFFTEANVFPLIVPAARLGLVIPKVQNLSLELSLDGVGCYSSLSRTYIGFPIVSVGMVNGL